MRKVKRVYSEPVELIFSRHDLRELVCGQAQKLVSNPIYTLQEDTSHTLISDILKAFDLAFKWHENFVIKGSVPILLVINRNLIPVGKVINFLGIKENIQWHDTRNINNSRSISGPNTLNKFHFLLGVEARYYKKGISHKERIEKINSLGCLPMTLDEIIYLFIQQPDIFNAGVYSYFPCNLVDSGVGFKNHTIFEVPFTNGAFHGHKNRGLSVVSAQKRIFS